MWIYLFSEISKNWNLKNLNTDFSKKMKSENVNIFVFGNIEKIEMGLSLEPRNNYWDTIFFFTKETRYPIFDSPAAGRVPKHL